MKASPQFKIVIQNYLNNRAVNDELFAETLKKTNKNIDDCITYIFNQVKTSGCNGFADEEIFQMAVHYYDEDDIKVGKPIKGTVVVNHSDFEGKKVPAQQKPKKSIKTDKQPKVVKINTSKQVSIFDFDDV